MTREQAITTLVLHLMQCGMLMPIEWVDKNGEGSDTMLAFSMAIDALREKDEREKLLQWLDDMDNPLEPIKIESAPEFEMMKLEFRKANRPKDVSILDYTIIAALAEALRQRLEVEP